MSAMEVRNGRFSPTLTKNFLDAGSWVKHGQIKAVLAGVAAERPLLVLNVDLDDALKSIGFDQ